MIKIYNTLTGHLDEFKPLKENEVSMYVGGPTVFNYIQSGHARPAIFVIQLEDIWNIEVIK